MVSRQYPMVGRRYPMVGRRNPMVGRRYAIVDRGCPMVLFCFALIILYSLYLEYDSPLIPPASGLAG